METRKIKLSRRVSITLDCFWKISASIYTYFYLLPQIKFKKINLEEYYGPIPKYVIQFNWLYLLADVNIFIEL